MATDKKNNLIKTQYAEYFSEDKIFKSTGPTEIVTNENYTILGSDINVNNTDKIISSQKNSVIKILMEIKFFWITLNTD